MLSLTLFNETGMKREHRRYRAAWRTKRNDKSTITCQASLRTIYHSLGGSEPAFHMDKVAVNFIWNDYLQVVRGYSYSGIASLVVERQVGVSRKLNKVKLSSKRKAQGVGKRKGKRNINCWALKTKKTLENWNTHYHCRTIHSIQTLVYNYIIHNKRGFSKRETTR